MPSHYYYDYDHAVRQGRKKGTARLTPSVMVPPCPGAPALQRDAHAENCNLPLQHASRNGMARLGVHMLVAPARLGTASCIAMVRGRLLTSSMFVMALGGGGAN